MRARFFETQCIYSELPGICTKNEIQVTDSTTKTSKRQTEAQTDNNNPGDRFIL